MVCHLDGIYLLSYSQVHVPSPPQPIRWFIPSPWLVQSFTEQAPLFWDLAWWPSPSAVCTFDLGTPQAGIIFKWSEENWYHESIQWYYDHHIPLWFVWSSKEESAISVDSSFAYLWLPNKLIQQALTALFTVPNVPLAGLIIQQYYRLRNNPITNKTIEFLSIQHVPSFVFEFTAKKFLRQQDALKQIHLGWTQDFIDTNLRAVKVSQENQCQAAFEAALLSFQYHGLTTKHQAPAEDAWSWPSEAALSSEAALTGLSSTYQCFLTSIKKKDKVFNHYNDFFAAQDEHQKEMMKVESSQDCQAHEHEQKTRVLNMQKFMNGRRHSCLVVRRCTSKSRSTRKPTKMSGLSTNLISTCSMHFQMSGIYAKISIWVDMVLVWHSAGTQYSSS